MSTPDTMKSMFSLLDVPSWVEDFDSSTKDAAARQSACQNFLILPEVEDQIRQILDRVHRKHGRGFLVTGLYGSGKTLFMAYLSAVMTEPVLIKELLDQKPEWGLDNLVNRKYLTINFTAIANQDQSLEDSLWDAVDRTFRSLSPPLHATISDTDNFLETFELWGEGSRQDVGQWLKDREGMDLEQLKTYDATYQKQQLEKAMADLGMKLDEQKTTLSEKVQILLRHARERGYDGVAVFIDELYMHLIQDDDTFNKDTAFLSQLAQAGMVEDRPFWVFAAMQEEIQAIARQAGRNYDTEVMGRLAGQAGRFQSINLPVTQFHRIYNHRLFKENSKKVHKLAGLFRAEIQPHYRGSFTDFFRRYFRTHQEVTDEAVHFADVYPVHPYAMHCLTKITNSGGRSRGALGFVDEFCQKAEHDNRDWMGIARLDDVFDYEDLRNKIIQDNPDIERFYGLHERFCTNACEEVLSRAPYRRYDDDKKAFVQNAADRLIKALIVLAMVKEELKVSQLNDALMLRWPEHEHDPAESDAETVRLLDKIMQSFSPLRKKGSDADVTFFLSVEGDGGERDELQNEIDRIVNGQDAILERESAYRSQLNLYLQQSGPQGGSTPPPQASLKSPLEVNWQRTRRQAVYMLEAVKSLTSDATVSSFLQEVPNTECLHLVLLYPSGTPVDVEMDEVSAGDGRVLAWLPATLQAQDIDEIRRSMALVRLHTDYLTKITAGGASVSDQRKLDIIGEMLGLPTARSEAKPSPEATRALQRAFSEGQIYRWSKTDNAWAQLLGPGELLGVITGIPQAEQSLQVVVDRLADTVLDSEHPLHPPFQTIYTASADLSSTMQKRLLKAVWDGRATDEDATAKKDLEKYLGPLSLIDTSRSDEVVVNISAGSSECFRKIRERVRDLIRKSTDDPQEMSVPDLRSRLKTRDTGLTDDWIDVALTLLLSLGEVTGIKTDDGKVSADDKNIGNPRDWLPQIVKLRSGSKPDDALWKDVVRSLQALGHTEVNLAYTNHAADTLHDLINDQVGLAEEELANATAALSDWSGATVPEGITEYADLFNIPPESRSNKAACLGSLRDALRDVVGLPADDQVDDPNRYQVVQQWAVKLQESRDFLVKVAEFQPIATRLSELNSAGLPGSLATDHAELGTKISEYVLTSGATGSLPEIKALWQDFQDAFRSQYNSEHAGINSDLQAVRDQVLGSGDYKALEGFSQVEGLSAHYSPNRINTELASLLSDVGMSDVCDPTAANLDRDLESGWCCTVCGYEIGTSKPLRADELIESVKRGLGEYVSHVQGFGEHLRDYVTDNAEAEPLLGLLEDPVPGKSLDGMDNEELRSHLANALEDASARAIHIDSLLAELKPELLGLYKGGGADFRTKIAAAVDELLATEPDDGQPWKVE